MAYFLLQYKDSSLAGVITAIMTAIGLFIVISAGLIKSISRSLYSYTNIMLIGGMIYLIVFILVQMTVVLNVKSDQMLTFSGTLATLLLYPRFFSYYAMFAFGIIGILLGISNVELMRKEGFRMKNALGILLALIYIGCTITVFLLAGYLGNYIRKLEAEQRSMAAAVGISVELYLLSLICYLECMFAGSAILGWIAARRIPRYDKDFIIILGCSINKKGGLLPLLKGRVNRAIRFAWDQERASGKPCRYVPSGGQGPGEVMSEGSAMELYLMAHGAEDYEVFPEKQSKNTYENLLFSKKVIDEQIKGSRVAVATTNYHLLRSCIIARRLGMDAEGVAGDTKWYFWPNGFIREFIAILAMHVRVHVIVGITIFICCTGAGATLYLL